ncbi:MAG TPA: methyltransferase domain-containing protein, partial [Thermoanaerobaculia bacterium]|nr:methyltransferase domain-containing protein [Thermoanaerobaculia bacterium]
VGRAEELPLADASVDAALAVLTVHHWSDQARGLAELRRVARDRVVVFCWDPAFKHRFWLFDYLPWAQSQGLPVRQNAMVTIPNVAIGDYRLCAAGKEAKPRCSDGRLHPGGTLNLAIPQ